MSIFAALLTKISNNGKTFQGKFLGKTKANIRNLTPYGFFSVPPVDSKLVMLKDVFETHYAISYKDSITPALKQNEAVIGNFVKGSTAKFDEDGNIDITCNGNETVTITGNCTINVTGNCNINATTTTIDSGGTGKVVVANGGTEIDLKDFLTHTHSGVTAGAGVTGGVV